MSTCVHKVALREQGEKVNKHKRLPAALLCPWKNADFLNTAFSTTNPWEFIRNFDVKNILRVTTRPLKHFSHQSFYLIFAQPCVARKDKLLYFVIRFKLYKAGC